MSGETRTVGEPHDRLTGICNDMLELLERHPDRSGGERCLIALSDGEHGRSGMVLHGYASDLDAALDLFAHLRAIFRVNGQDLRIARLGRG